MVGAPKLKMDVKEFLAWGSTRSERYELIAGRPYVLAQETADHRRAQAAVYTAFSNAIAERTMRCEVVGDGAIVAVDTESAFRPYALVRCGGLLGNASIVIQDPLIVVEFVFTFARGYDTMGKLAGYFALPSTRHYLIVDGEGRTVTHCRRQANDITTRFLAGTLRLDPPGLDVSVEDMLDTE